jgi:hypothetical protein
MLPSKRFIRFASVCCFLSVVTTLGIHVLFPEPSGDFEERIKLYQNSIYILNRWWIIAHCLLVLVAMWGFALIQLPKAPGFIGLGFLCFAVFAVAEITRQMFVLFYINNLREQYELVADVVQKQNIKSRLMYAGALTSPLFGVFILFFALGNFNYGLSLWKAQDFGKFISVILLVWAAGTFSALGNSFWKSPTLDKIIEVYNLHSNLQSELFLLYGFGKKQVVSKTEVYYSSSSSWHSYSFSSNWS